LAGVPQDDQQAVSWYKKSADQGWSEASLPAANARPPFILVGHSLGGLYMQMFARK